MKGKFKYLALFIGTFLLNISCRKILDHPITGSISDDNIAEILANDPSQISAFLDNGYRTDICNNWVYGRELSKALQEMAHEVDLDYTADVGWNEFSKNDVTSGNSYISYYYNYLYRAIASANLTIDLSDKMLGNSSLSLPPGTITQIQDYKGEALFMRAFSHFLLLNLFGEKGPRFGGAYPNNKDAKGIILMKELANDENAYATRSTVGECFESIVDDLIKAKDLIGDNQIPVNNAVQTPGFIDNDYIQNHGWAQKPAVTALLGKVYLYMNEYEKAKTEFELVIGDSRFKLDRRLNFTDYIQHNDNNTESIFALQFFEDANGQRQHQVARTNTNVPSAWKNTFIDPRSLARFGSDPRIYEATLYDYTWSTWSTATAPPVWKQIDPMAPDFRCYPRKYVNFYDYASPRDNTKNQELIRLADVYLMYAEASLGLGNTAVATEYVNKVRRRGWGEDDYNSPGTMGEDLTTIDLPTLQEERFKELFFEYDRWFDLCRWQILEQELTKYPTTRAGVVTYNQHDYYLPIPEKQIKTNPTLKQSEGY
jgi:hypothetical protein